MIERVLGKPNDMSLRAKCPKINRDVSFASKQEGKPDDAILRRKCPKINSGVNFCQWSVSVSKQWSNSKQRCIRFISNTV